MHAPQFPWPASLCRREVLTDDNGWRSGDSQHQRNFPQVAAEVDEAYRASEMQQLKRLH